MFSRATRTNSAKNTKIIRMQINLNRIERCKRYMWYVPVHVWVGVRVCVWAHIDRLMLNWCHTEWVIVWPAYKQPKTAGPKEGAKKKAGISQKKSKNFNKAKAFLFQLGKDGEYGWEPWQTAACEVERPLLAIYGICYQHTYSTHTRICKC